ncbi:sulfotransferase ssu-1-like [Centruroides vittatus]|uniref:sulfotransferase ssu-1-like n=1 Tax=Centruroides vittatus TaxID=120091 RepID=UPI00350F3A6F
MEKLYVERRNKLSLNNVDGFLFTDKCSVKNFRQALSFKPRANDIIIAGYPKSGTTWLQYIIWEIISRKKTFPNVNEMRWKEVPQLEMAGTEELEKVKSSRLLKVNLPFNLTPYHPSVKYIYVIRNPWDCCISAFNYYKQIDECFSDGTFEDYFGYFIKGETTHGDYFEHLLSWYSRWKDPNVLFLTYEEMKRDIRNVVLKIAAFVGKEYQQALNKDNELLEDILCRLHFRYMKENCPFYLSTDSETKINFFHTGRVGQWKEYFTEDQNAILKNKFIEKLKNTEIIRMWQNSDIP